MDNRDFPDLGDKIRDTVQSAIDSKDYRQLNKTISDTVNFALDEARRQIVKGAEGSPLQTRFRPGQSDPGGPETQFRPGHGGSGAQDAKSHPQGEPAGGRPVGNDYHTAYHNSWAEKRRGGEAPGYHAFQNSGPADNLWTKTGRADIRQAVKSGDLTAVMKQPGKVAGILYTVFGGIGLGVTGILFIVIWLLAMLVKPFWGAIFGSSILLLILGGVFTTMLGMGITMRGRLKRAEVYLKQTGSRTYCRIEELAGSMGKSPKFVTKDLQKLIEKGILPGAHIDEQKTCLILDETTYQQYLQAQKSLRQRQEETLPEKKKGTKRLGKKNSGQAEAEGQEGSAPGTEEELPEETRKIIAQGQDYLRILREANEAIPGEVISRKLTRLETVITQIFASVEKHPEQIGEIERFMSYYLPTTVKLVNAYRDFDGAKVQGGNIVSAKHDIEETLDTINGAFERLLDDLYKDKALDASTDAAVLQTMLKKDGWMGSDFNKNKEDKKQ